jgi:transposase
MSATRKLPARLETDPAKALELLVGLPEVNVLGIFVAKRHTELHVETRTETAGCPECGAVARFKGFREVLLADLPAFGKPTRLHWHKRRFSCVEAACPTGHFTEEDRRIAPPRMKLTDRAGRAATKEVGYHGRTVNEVATSFGCDWHTLNDAVMAYGRALVDAPGRFGEVEAIGLDEVAFVRAAPYGVTQFSTSIVDVRAGQLLDVVPGRGGAEPAAWLRSRSEDFRSSIRYGTLDLSGTYRAVFEEVLPDAVLVADPFHVVKLANDRLDDCRRRVQNDVLGHRGRKGDPLYRCRHLLTRADERLSDKGRTKLVGLLRAGDPHGEVATTWHAKEAVRELYAHHDEALALEWLDRLSEDMKDKDQPVEVRALGRTLERWRRPITAWHGCLFTNGPTEAINNLIKRVKRVAFGFRRFAHYRVRALLYAGKPDWSLLEVITPV